MPPIPVVTVRTAAPAIPADAAVIIVEPAVDAVAVPLELIAATEEKDELQVADAVRSFVELSE